MTDKLANPAPLGLLGFGITTILLNLHNAGFFPLDTMILAMGLAYGGLAQVIVGIMEFKKGNTFGTTAFTSYGLFWWSLVLLLILPNTPISCPKCDSFLVKRIGPKGKFLGCCHYPKCDYIQELEDLSQRYEDKKLLTINSLPKYCDQCGKPLAIRKGPYGGFLGCTGYPNCKYTFNLSKNTTIVCPRCNSPLIVRKGPYGTFLGCSNYPRCKYILDRNKKFRR